MIDSLKALISKYETLSQVRTVRIIEDIKNIIAEAQNTKIPQTPLEDMQQLYIQKYGSIPHRYKNDIKWLSSKL